MTTLFNLNDYHTELNNHKAKKRGNPNFTPKYSNKTTVIRVPVHLKDKIKELTERLDKGENIEVSQDNSVTEVKPLTVCELPIEQIHCDPYRFQFKLISNSKTGSTGSLKGVNVWNPDLAGIILVWKDPNDGKTYVVNGHNRLDKAVTLGVKTMTVRYCNAKTAKGARLIGAMANIADGKGTALDAGKIFRESNLTQDDLKSYGVKLKDSLANDGLAIANLLPYLFENVMTGKTDQKIGIAIGQVSQDKQTELDTLIKKEKRTLTKTVLSELVNLINNSSIQSSLDLFGNEVNQCNAICKAELISFIKAKLSKESLLFSKVSKSQNKSILEKGNNVIDQGESSKIADETARVLALFDQLKNEAGDVSYWLNHFADKLVNASKTEALVVKNEAYDRIWALLNLDSILDLVG